MPRENSKWPLVSSGPPILAARQRPSLQSGAAFLMALAAAVLLLDVIPGRCQTGERRDPASNSVPAADDVPRSQRSDGKPDAGKAAPVSTSQESDHGTGNANPLLIRPERTESSAMGQSDLSEGFADRRRREEAKKRPKFADLPLFGYEIFRFARETVDAQRRYIRGRSVMDLDGGSQAGALPRRSVDNPSRGLDATIPGSAGSTRGRRSGSAEYGPTSARPAPQSDSDSGTDDRGFDRDAGIVEPSRRGDTGPEGENQNAFATPVGPISLLYRGISASVPDNYTLASGDQLRIRIESPTLQPFTIRTTVDPRGQIRLSDVGIVVVRGKSIESLEKDLEIRLRPFYRGARVSVEAGALRTMQVLVTGAVYEPGTYTVPATATAFNLLNIAGGPSDDGTLRMIEVRRQGRQVALLDIYKMAMGDRQWSDAQLLPGDVIVVPPRRSRVSVTGEVLHPAVFEMLPTEGVRDALAYAGGVKATGLNQSVRVNTVVPGSERVIRDFNLDEGQRAHGPLFDGDEIEVFSLRNRLNNRVSVEGAVDQPNDYALTAGMRISDLIERARGPLPEAYLRRAELHRWQADNTDLLVVVDLDRALAHDPTQDLELHKWDRLRIYSREEVAWTGRRQVKIEGAVKRPGIYDVSRNMHVSDLLRMAGGPTPNAELERAHVFHHNDDRPDTHEYVNIAAAIKGDPDRDPLVLDSDRLVIFTVAQSEFTPEHRVDVRGEVVNPGRYPRFDGMRASDLLALAGGFKPSANNQVILAHARRVAGPSGSGTVTIKFDRNLRCETGSDVPLEDGDVLSVQGLGGYQAEVQAVTVRGAVNSPGVVFLKTKEMRLSDAIRQTGGLRPEAYPDGAVFYRNPVNLATGGQRTLVQSLSGLNDMLNDSETKRELAKAQLELIRASGSASQDNGGLLGPTGSTTPNPAAAALAANLSGAQLVSPARKLTGAQLDPTGFVAVDLRSALSRNRSLDDILLVDGDEIWVPERPTTVSIVGAVNSPRGILYESGRRLNDYIDLAGGLAPDAAANRIEIFHIGGGVIPGNRVKEIKPGDVIYVPPKVLAAKLGGRSNGFDSFFRSLASSAILYKLTTGIFGL